MPLDITQMVQRYIVGCLTGIPSGLQYVARYETVPPGVSHLSSTKASLALFQIIFADVPFRLTPLIWRTTNEAFT